MTNIRILATFVIILVLLVAASTTILYASSSNTKGTDSKSSSSITSSSSSQSKPANITTQVSNSSKSNSSADYMIGAKAGRIDGSVGVRDAGAACAHLNGTRLDQCIQGYNTSFNAVCKTTKFGCSG
jgi:hypothetical protein